MRVDTFQGVAEGDSLLDSLPTIDRFSQVLGGHHSVSARMCRCLRFGAAYLCGTCWTSSPNVGGSDVQVFGRAEAKL